jgi:hypothetical protein
LTDLFPPHIKPVRVGVYLTQWYDAGWNYDWYIWFDGRHWRDAEGGWALSDQNVTWRGLKENANADHG